MVFFAKRAVNRHLVQFLFIQNSKLILTFFLTSFQHNIIDIVEIMGIAKKCCLFTFAEKSVND